MRFTLDSNILYYAADRDSASKHEKAKQIVEWMKECDCLLTIQALGEFYNSSTRVNRRTGRRTLDHGVATAYIRAWAGAFHVHPHDTEALMDALAVSAEHTISFWDAMLWATARLGGCAVILTEDMQDRRRLGGVEIMDPFKEGAMERLALMLAGRSYRNAGSRRKPS